MRIYLHVELNPVATVALVCSTPEQLLLQGWPQYTGFYHAIYWAITQLQLHSKLDSRVYTLRGLTGSFI